MDKTRVEAALERALETLAAIEHERWSHWQRYMHGKGMLQADGSLLLPADLVRRWEAQMTTFYADLTEAEKDSDREQVRTYLRAVIRALDRSHGS